MSFPAVPCLADDFINGRGEGEHRGGAAAGDEPPGEKDEDDEDEDDDDYEDDYDWEGEEEDGEGGAQPVGAGGGRRGAGGRGGGAGGPSSLERSFRESFASVNNVLSAIAGRKAASALPPASASSTKDGTPTSVFNDVLSGHGRRTTTTTTTSSTATAATTRPTPQAGRPETRGTAYYSSAESASPASPAPLSLRFSPPYSSKRGRRGESESGSLSAAAGETDAAFSSRLALGSSATESPGRDEAFAAAAAKAGAETGPGRGDGAAAGGEVEMPPEMSGMLQRYSEMMLRVVQVGDFDGVTCERGCSVFFCCSCFVRLKF